jgi:hypothetical protein
MRSPDDAWMVATLDGLVKETGTRVRSQVHAAVVIFRKKLQPRMARFQHNMLVAGTRKFALSIINGGGKWIELSIEADPVDIKINRLF